MSIPVSFLLGVVGTMVGAGRTSPEEAAELDRRAAEMEVRSMTGAGTADR